MKKYLLVEYKGTPESFEQMVKDLKLTAWDFMFVDDDFKECQRFTGNVHIHKEGVLYRAGDHYRIEVDEQP